MNQLVSISQLSWVPSELAVAAGAIDSETTEKAKKGDIAALKAVDAYLANPAAKACWGDMGRFVFTKWAEHLAGKGTLGYHALIRFASDMRTNLAGPNANALDWLLAERVVVAWLFVQWSEWQYAGQFDKLNLKQSAYYIRRNEMANRNLMSACRTLAKVKRAKLPDVLAVVSVKAPRTVSTEVESAKSHI